MKIILQILAIIGVIETIFLVFGLIWAAYLWFQGILPVLLRLGNGLAKRKIAIFAKGDNLTSLKNLLLDSGLFQKRNIIEITNIRDLAKAEKASVFLVLWQDWAKDITRVANKKLAECPLVVYAPVEGDRIPDIKMKELDGEMHTTVVNFRGRLLNDIVTSIITTSYER